MSIDAITWAFQQPIKHSSAKFVLVALANHADAKNGRAWPSVASLCKTTCQDRKTVMANLKRLLESGFIQDTDHRMGHTKSVVVYRLSCADIGTTEDSQNRDTCTDKAIPESLECSTEFPRKSSQYSVQAVPKPVPGTVKNLHRTVNKEDPTVLLIGIDPQIVADYLQVRKGKKATLTKTAVDGLIREGSKAGLNLEQTLRMCCERNWVGFKAQWLVERAGSAEKKLETVYQQSMRQKFEIIAPDVAARNPAIADPNHYFDVINVSPLLEKDHE